MSKDGVGMTSKQKMLLESSSPLSAVPYGAVLRVAAYMDDRYTKEWEVNVEIKQHSGPDAEKVVAFSLTLEQARELAKFLITSADNAGTE